jgi:hypothetical protein
MVDDTERLLRRDPAESGAPRERVVVAARVKWFGSKG